MSSRDALIGTLALSAAYVYPTRATTWYKLPAAVLVVVNFAVILTLWYLRWSISRASATRRQAVEAKVRQEEDYYANNDKESPKSEDEGWEKVQNTAAGRKPQGPAASSGYKGIMGFFHPFANAGGGGERVLWAAVKATQEKNPQAISVIYTGDTLSNKYEILARVKDRFDIQLHEPTIVFIYLTKRHWVVASTFPYFTLLGQSLGSLLVAHEALSLLRPDIFVDTMGYSFSSWYCKTLFPEVGTASYVHYPFIGTHMVQSLNSDNNQGVNAGTGQGAKGFGKKVYWNTLLMLYKATGLSIDVVMTNSSWTQGQMAKIWGPARKNNRMSAPQVVYPPVSVDEIIHRTSSDATKRDNIVLCIAQFRPEKNHEILIQAFARMSSSDARLVLIGSVRDATDETLVYKLRLLAKELKVDDRIDFRIDISWSEIVDCLKKSSVGANGMWCEHFGIGVVEYQAAGLICVVNDSGGPKEDIVVDVAGGPTGFHASTVEQYASAFDRALQLPAAEVEAMRERNRESSRRFTTERFAAKWEELFDQVLKTTNKK